MRPERLIKRLLSLSGRDAALHAVGENVGNELPRDRLDLLRSFLSDLARLQGTTGSSFTKDPFVNGYVFALRDIIHAYTAQVSHDQDVDEAARKFLDLGFRHLFAEIWIPGEVGLERLVQVVGLPVEIVRPQLTFLIQAGLVEAAVPPQAKMAIFHLTSRGEQVWARMQALHADP